VPDLFFAGVRPAIDVGISVSRVGGKAQVKGMRKVAGSLRLDLAAYRELEAFAQLGTELDPATQKRLDRGARMVEILKQPQYEPMAVVDQILIIYAGSQGHLDSVPLDRVREFERKLLESMRTTHSELRKRIADAREIPADIQAKLDATIQQMRDAFLDGKAHDPR
jgi:F-type H+-transporting ATPase subunit alpha